MKINITFSYDPNKPILGKIEIDGKWYPYTSIEQEEDLTDPQQLDLWGNPLFLT